MEMHKTHWIGLISGVVILIADFVFFFGEKIFYFLIGIGLAAAVLPFVLGLMRSGKRDEEIATQFLEFSRNLSEGVATGTPISRSIVNVSTKDYGALTPFIQKLARQISLGVPVSQALGTFAADVKSPVISRSVALMSEAEKAGGQIEQILQSVSASIAEVEKLKKQRKAGISNLVVQGYIIFIIFIGIMLVMEFKILPMTTGLGGGFGGFGGSGGSLLGGGGASSGPAFSAEEMAKPFLYLLLAQGFFVGLVIGKLAEGALKKGVKHSFILVLLAFLISTGAKALLG